MIELFSQRGTIVRQLQIKINDGAFLKMLASNLNTTDGTAWQCLFKHAVIDRSFPEGFGFFVALFDAANDPSNPYCIQLTETEARAKLKAWGMTAAEIDNLVNSKFVEVK